VFTGSLPSTGHPIFVTRLNGKVFTGSLPSTGHPIVAYSLPRDVFTGPLPATDDLPLLVKRWLERVYRAVA
jgi:hypothetical protein